MKADKPPTESRERVLLEALKALMKDYNEQYQMLTDSQYGRTPATPAWKAAVRLVAKIEKR